MNGLSFFHLISQMATVALILVKYLYFTIIEPVPAKYLKYKSLEISTYVVRGLLGHCTLCNSNNPSKPRFDQSFRLGK